MSSVPFIPTSESNENNTFVTVSAALSFAGCFFVLVTYVWLQLTKQFHFKVIFILTVVDLCISIVFIAGSRFSYLDPPAARPYVCNSLDTILHFLFVASFMWTACIAHMLLQVINYEDDNIDRFFKYYNLISWGVPTAVVLVLVLRHVWFNVTCDSTDLSEYGIVRILFFIPLLLSWIYNIFAFIKLSRKLHKEQKLHRQIVRLVGDSVGSYSSTPGIVHTHRLFLVAFAICWIWGILLAFFEFFQVRNIGWVINLNYIFTPLPGLFNSIIFGMNDELKSRVSQFLNGYWCCRTIRNDDVNTALLTDKYDNEEFLRWRVTTPAYYSPTVQ